MAAIGRPIRVDGGPVLAASCRIDLYFRSTSETLARDRIQAIWFSVLVVASQPHYQMRTRSDGAR
jgi:hypothetical protein